MLTTWLSLAIAILFSVIGTICMKASDGLHKLIPVIVMTITYIISFIGMTYAIQRLDLSIVYALWSGIGTLLTALLATKLFNESLTRRKWFYLVLIVIGVIGIHINDILY